MGLGGEGLGCQSRNSLEWVGPGEVGGLGAEAHTGQGRPPKGRHPAGAGPEGNGGQREELTWVGREGVCRDKGDSHSYPAGAGLGESSVGRRGWGAGRRWGR